MRIETTRIMINLLFKSGNYQAAIQLWDVFMD
jgi:pentatricopeptide repeat protein